MTWSTLTEIFKERSRPFLLLLLFFVMAKSSIIVDFQSVVARRKKKKCRGQSFTSLNVSASILQIMYQTFRTQIEKFHRSSHFFCSASAVSYEEYFSRNIWVGGSKKSWEKKCFLRGVFSKNITRQNIAQEKTPRILSAEEFFRILSAEEYFGSKYSWRRGILSRSICCAVCMYVWLHI